MQRKLAAILAADVVGYARMLGEDEAATVAALKALRDEVFGPVFADHKGVVVKSMGDGWLVEFSSAVEAVNAAMQVQDRLKSHPGIALRMGMHIGDITRSEDDLYGDGINIAARLEALAPPGGILISDAVYSSLDGTLSPSFEAAGDRSLKNIARTVTTWLRVPQGERTLTGVTRPHAAANLPQLSLSPVSFSDPRPEVQDLANALAADLATHFASVNWLGLAPAGEQSSHAYILQSTLRSQGNRLRLECRLTAPDGSSVWSHKADSTLEDSFDWQDKVVAETAAAATDMILEAETLKLTALPDDQLTGEQCLLMGMMSWQTFDGTAFLRSVTYHDRAIRARPDMADAYAEAIIVVNAARTMDYLPEMEQFIAKVPGWIEAARPLAPGHAMLTLAIGLATYSRDGRSPPLKQAVAQALRLAPFDARVLSFCGWANLWSGQTQDALEFFSMANAIGRLGPFYVASLAGAAISSVQLGLDAQAVSLADQGLALSDSYSTLYCSKAAALAWLGDLEAAQATMARYLVMEPGRTLKKWRATNGYGGGAGAERYFEGLRRAGLPEG